MEFVVFVIASLVSLVGAVGLVASKNPVHSALFMVMPLFGIAVLFLNQDAQFLAAVQIVVYAGAIVVLFLFVIMLLGVDQVEDFNIEPIVGQRRIALFLAAAIGVLAIILGATTTITGQHEVTATKLDSYTNSSVPVETLPDDQVDGTEANPNIDQIGRTLFTDSVYAFEITALLLTIAVVGAVMLARKPQGELAPIPETALEAMAQREEAGEA